MIMIAIDENSGSIGEGLADGPNYFLIKKNRWSCKKWIPFNYVFFKGCIFTALLFLIREYVTLTVITIQGVMPIINVVFCRTIAG